MKLVWIGSVCAVMVLVTGWTRPVAAQTRDNPYIPTLSPWLNLYQRNTGPLDPYHQYVRPEIQLRDALRQQDNRLRSQSANIQILGQEVSQMGQAGVRTTGTGSVFMNYSHFYPTGQGATIVVGGRTAQTPRAPAQLRVPGTQAPRASSRVTN
jgi:hypothetical protein